jgi:hexosaminidase
MISASRIYLVIIGFAFLLGCDHSKPTSPEAKLTFESVIPKPVSANLTGNTFELTNKTTIVIDSSGEEISAIGNYLAARFSPATGFDIAVSVGDVESGSGSILLTTKGGDPQWGREGYELSITEDQIKITANAPVGLFWGIQTLRQLMPEEIEGSTTAQDAIWEIATGTIQDYPEYAWRGSMLDVARHFFGVEDVKHYIDLISYYKMNVLHLHLTDDQGWRIEIKSWPNLTETGGSTQVGGGKGGFYTQEEYADIVSYAKSRYITIVPEIDMPGHINAALVSYAELNQGPRINREAGPPNNPAQGSQEFNGEPTPGVLYTGIEVGFSTLDIKKKVTFRFVNDVLRELALMTPGPYLHIGGDEAAVTKKADYIAFVNRFKEIVEANNKKMIGWEEIAQADLDSTVTVQHWHSQKYAKMAAEKGAKLIFSPAEKVYLDMQYDSTTKLGLHWAAYIEVDSSYMWDPATRVKGIDREQIRGVEAPLWSETLVTMDDIEYMLFPRMPGVAEVGWTAAKDRDWEDYKVRLGNQSKRWKAMDINFYRSPKVPWID